MTTHNVSIQALYLDDLSDIEVEAIQEDLKAAGLGNEISVTQRPADAENYGAFELSSIALVLTPAAVTVFANWLVRFAPPQPVKRVIVIEDKVTGTKLTETITYAKSTPVAGLAKALEKALQDLA